MCKVSGAREATPIAGVNHEHDVIYRHAMQKHTEISVLQGRLMVWVIAFCFGVGEDDISLGLVGIGETMAPVINEKTVVRAELDLTQFLDLIEKIVLGRIVEIEDILWIVTVLCDQLFGDRMGVAYRVGERVPTLRIVVGGDEQSVVLPGVGGRVR